MYVYLIYRTLNTSDHTTILKILYTTTIISERNMAISIILLWILYLPICLKCLSR